MYPTFLATNRVPGGTAPCPILRIPLIPTISLPPETYQLRNGLLVTISPILIRRLKSHFIALPCGVDVILGLNGFIWVMKGIQERHQQQREGEEGFDGEGVYSNVNDVRLLFFPAPYSRAVIDGRHVVADAFSYIYLSKSLPTNA